jgi:hypothetical protein
MGYITVDGQRLAVAGKLLRQGAVVAPIPTAGLVAWIEADTNVSLGGSEVIAISDQAGSTHFTRKSGGVGPTVEQLSNGSEVLRFASSNGGMVAPIGSLPVGAAPRTIFAAVSADTSGIFGGLVYGADAQLASCGIVISTNELVRFDARNAGFDSSVPGTEMRICSLTYDGAVAVLRVDGVSAQQTIALNTGSTIARMMLSWSGNAQLGDVGAWIVYSGVLTGAQIAEVEAYLTAKYKTPVTDPAITSPSITGVGGNVLNVGWTVDRAGVTYLSAGSSSTMPSSASIENGTGMEATAQVTVGVAGAAVGTLTGLTAGTRYVWGFHRDAGGRNSPVAAFGSASISGSASAATISISDVAEGPTTALVTFTTNKSGGSVFRMASDNAVEDDDDIIAAGISAPVLATGSQTVTVTGLTPSDTGYVHLVQRDGDSLKSNVASAAYTTVAQPSSGSFDAFAATSAEVIAIFNAWKVGGSAPITAPKRIGVTASLGSQPNWSNFNLPHQVTIQPYGAAFTATDPVEPDCSIKITGGVNLANSRNIRMYLWRFDNVGSNGVNIHGSTDITIERCYVRSNYNSSGIPTAFALMDFGATRPTIKDCFLKGATSSMIYFHNGTSTDPRTEGCMFEDTGHDDLKAANVLIRHQFINNWCGRQRRGTAYSTHDDWFQHQNGGLDNCYYRGNIQWRTSAWWSGGIGGPHQGIYTGSTDKLFHIDNTEWTQNIAITSDRGLVLGQPDQERFPELYNLNRKDLHFSYNTCISVPWKTTQNPFCWIDAGAGGPIMPTYDHNFVASYNDNGAHTGDGLFVDRATFDDYSGVDALFVNQSPRNDPNSMMEAMIPKTGTRLHWNHVNPVGAYLRTRELVDATYQLSLAQPTVPLRVGWPVASVCKRRYYHNAAMSAYVAAMGYTGRFDTNGNNAP